MKKSSILLFFILGSMFFPQKTKKIGKTWDIQKVHYQGVFYEYFDGADEDLYSSKNTVYFAPVQIQSELREFFANISSGNKSADETESVEDVVILSPDQHFQWFENSFITFFQLPRVPQTLYYELSRNASDQYQLIATDITTGNQIYYELRDIGSRKTRSKRKSNTGVLTVGELTGAKIVDGKNTKKAKPVFKSIKEENEAVENLLNHLPKRAEILNDKRQNQSVQRAN